MKIQFNLINFTASQKTIKDGQNTIVKFYDDNNFLKRLLNTMNSTEILIQKHIISLEI